MPHSARQLSDQDLRHRVFTISNPEELPDLVPNIPQSDIVPEIEYAYDVTPRKNGSRRELVFCAHCGYPTHFRGYVVKYGACRCLIGKDCGSKLYGADFHSQERGFSEERRRQLNLVRLDQAIKAFPNLLRSLAEIVIDPSTEIFDQTRSVFRTKLPNLWSRLSAFSDGLSDLTVMEEVRDYAAEQRRDERSGADENSDTQDEQSEPIYTFMSRSIGPLHGAAFCQHDLRSAVTTFREAHERLKNEFYRLQRIDTNTLSTRQISNLINSTDADVTKLLKYERPMSVVTSFFGPENLGRIAEWANQSPVVQGQYEARGPSLWLVSSGSSVGIVILHGYSPPNFLGLHSFLRNIR